MSSPIDYDSAEETADEYTAAYWAITGMERRTDGWYILVRFVPSACLADAWMPLSEAPDLHMQVQAFWLVNKRHSICPLHLCLCPKCVIFRRLYY